MKTLLVLRHAKAAHPESGSDHDRPLTERGCRNAVEAGTVLARHALAVDLILSSTSERTRQTVEHLLPASGLNCAPVFDRELYHASVPQLLSVIQALPENCLTVLLVGHNPGLSELVSVLTGWIPSFPTAALVQLDLSIDTWGEISEHTRGQRQWLFNPKDATGF